MVYQAVISAVEGDRCRVVMGGRVSAPLPRMRVLKEEREQELREELTVGDRVAVAVFGGSLADGLILGKVVGE